MWLRVDLRRDLAKLSVRGTIQELGDFPLHCNSVNPWFFWQELRAIVGITKVRAFAPFGCGQRPRYVTRDQSSECYASTSFLEGDKNAAYEAEVDGNSKCCGSQDGGSAGSVGTNRRSRA